MSLIRLTDYPEALVVGNVIGAAVEFHFGNEVRCSFATVFAPVTGDDIGVPQWELVG